MKEDSPIAKLRSALLARDEEEVVDRVASIIFDAIREHARRGFYHFDEWGDEIAFDGRIYAGDFRRVLLGQPDPG